MMSHMPERRQTIRIQAEDEIFVSINERLCKVHDISLDGLAFDYDCDAAESIMPSDTMEIFFMSGPILYIENIPYTIVADIPLHNPGTRNGRRRACTRFNDLNFRQVITFNQLMTNHLSG